MKTKKQLKKEEDKRKKELKKSLEYNQSIINTIITLVIVVVIFVGFYLLTDYILNKSRKLNYKEPEEKEATIQYKEILASQVFDQNDEEYYVLFYNFDGNDAAYYNQIVSTTELKLYTVNINNPFNKNIVSEKTNKNAQNFNDLRVKEATIIKINNGKNVFYFEGNLLYIKENLK